MVASKQRKGKGRGRAKPSTSVTIAILAGEELFDLPPPTTVLEAILCDVPLVTNAEAPLSSKGYPRHLETKGPILVDEGKAKKAKEEGIRAWKRRKRQEAFTSILIDMSSEGTQSTELYNLPIVRAVR